MKRTVVFLSALVLMGPVASGSVRFTLPFDGTATAQTPGGSVKPVKTGTIAYGPGRTGQAAHFPYGKATPLVFAAKDVLKFEEGTVTFWFKPDPVKGDDEYGSEDAYCRPWADFFRTQTPKGGRHGSGQLWFWHNYYGHVRADRSDDIDCYNVNSQRLIPGEWNHLAYTWDREKAQVSVNGHVERTRRQLRAIMSALKKGKAVVPNELTFSEREDFVTFEIGGGDKPAGGWIDDLEIRDTALSPEEIVALAGGEKPNIVPPAEWLAKPNPYEAPPQARSGDLGRMELLDRVTFDSPSVIENLTKNDRWSLVGPTRFGELDGRKYLELGTNREDRCAVRFRLDGKGTLYCFEIDYPDNTQRTVDFTVQLTKNKRQYPVPLAFHLGLNTYDYALQVGVMGGDEYRPSMRMLTHRCVYWAADPDVTLLAVTARPGLGGAAMAEVRVYRIVDDALPVAKVNPPARNAAGWNRTFGAWFEDPALHYDFASEGFTMAKMMTQVERTCAWMKYTGYDILAYPFCWYPGVIGYEGQCARGMPLGIEQLYYARFDKEGLGLMPTMNLDRHRMPDSFGGLTKDCATDGSAYGSVLTVDDRGEAVEPSRDRRGQALFNFSHPETQAEIERNFDLLVANGKDHPSFRGVGIFIHHRNIFTFINEHLGYNDYTVEAFAKEKGLTIPVDRKDPLRGKAYAAWLRANAWDAWLDWRCEVVARFYRRLAAKLAAVRPDAKLVLNTWLDPKCRNPDEAKPGFLSRLNYLAGFDAARFAGVPNISVAQSITPADYRHRVNGVFANAPYDPAARAADRTRYLMADDYEISRLSNFPWVHQHERYWEDLEGLKSICAKTNSLANAWLDESIWRVSVINPAGRHALRFFAVPLGHCDLMAMTKGGYLVGTYGTEDVLVPFIRAFRALPAVKMTDVPGGPDGIVLRHADFGGKSYFYLLNVTDEPRTVTVGVPRGTRNLVTGGEPEHWQDSALETKRVEIRLDAYQLMSFVAEKGVPCWYGPELRDVAYAPGHGEAGLADIYLPKDASPSTPVILTIHGGGWRAGSRASTNGKAHFFRDELGFAVVNIAYRLNSQPGCLWPACGDDCVAAANWILSDEFTARTGLKPEKIWITGGSAGGHLALWTLTHLPPDKVAGVISVSSIGDPLPDFKVNPGRYRCLLGSNMQEKDLAAIDPRRSIRPGMAPVLCTHATEDQVVPIASHKAFAEAYRQAGNVCRFFEYPCDIRPGLRGHCIMEHGTRLIPELEAQIKDFVKEVRDK